MAGPYADYAFYKTKYIGSAIANEDYPRLAFRASRVIDQVTFGRAAAVITDDTDTDTIELIRMATCAVSEELFTQEQGGGVDGITSERVGSYSVSYATGARATLSNEERAARAAKTYLGNSGLMYRGLLDGE